MKSLARLATVTLGWNLLVILWGAVVRATGSGAGCGAHWPSCNGEVIPLAPSIGTLIEYSHRATSGIALLLVALLCYSVFRHRAASHPARFWAAASMALILSEAAVGAGLVLFEKVAGDTSVARGFWISGHLINTFLLLAALTLTVRFADARRVASNGVFAGFHEAFPRGRPKVATLGLIVALVITGISGAIAALGETLFPSLTLAEGIAKDFSSASHVFLRLRVFHPIIALGGGAWILFAAYRIRLDALAHPAQRKLAVLVAALVVGQWLLGLINLILLAPTGLQIAHLLMADLIWITLILAIAEPAE